jgi:hypothetical protein
MNLVLSVVFKGEILRELLVDFVLGNIALVCRVISAPLQRAAEKNTEVFVQMGEESTG